MIVPGGLGDRSCREERGARDGAAGRSRLIGSRFSLAVPLPNSLDSRSQGLMGLRPDHEALWMPC